MRLASLASSARVPSRMSLLVLILAVCTSTSWLLPSQAHAIIPEFTGDTAAFYKLPASYPATAHGTLVRWQQVDKLAPLLTELGDGVAGFRMMYVSTGADNLKTYVTGVLLVPARAYDGFWQLVPAPRPIVGFGTGTQGMADRCASSFGLQSGNNYDAILIRQALDKGWAVAVSDYQGLGTTPAYAKGTAGYKEDEHTYVVGSVLGKNVIDSVRVAFQFDGVATTAIKAIDFPFRVGLSAVLRTTSKVVFWGYSEGGNAAAWAGSLQPAYDSALNMRAVAAGGIPADIIAVGNAINTRYSWQNTAFGVLIAAGIGFKQAYPTLPLDEYLTDEGKELVAQVKDECFIDNLISGVGFRVITDYTKEITPGVRFNPLVHPDWVVAFNKNKLNLQPAPAVPTFMYHANPDEGIVYSQGVQAARDWCRTGKVKWKSYVGEHAIGFLAGMEDALSFLAARIDNQNVGTTACSDIN